MVYIDIEQDDNTTTILKGNADYSGQDAVANAPPKPFLARCRHRLGLIASAQVPGNGMTA
jgi:hypothetical protein